MGVGGRGEKGSRGGEKGERGARVEGRHYWWERREWEGVGVGGTKVARKRGGREGREGRVGEGGG